MIDELQWELMGDEELIQHIRQAEDTDEALHASDVLMERYKEMVRGRARAYFLIGADRDDVVQEGMIGLYKAIMDYQPDKNENFYSFAELCVTRQILTAIKLSSRLKHWPLNSYISLDKPVNDDEGKETTMINLLPDQDSNTPEEILTGEEDQQRLKKEINHQLSSLEKEVLKLFLEGMDYMQIAEQLDMKPKAVDNALQRIKRKISLIS